MDVAASHVTLEFELAANSPSGADLFWTWGEAAGSFAREHRYASILPGTPLRVSSAPGEQWVVRKASRAGEGAILPELLMEVTAAEKPEKQHHRIVVPPARA